MSDTDLYAVLGNPIAHSKSPRIHALFAQQTGHKLEYRAMQVEPGRFRQTADVLREQGGKGCNITVPCKEDAWVYANQLGPQAERARAVNTLHFRDNGEVYGDTTDGLGLVRDLTHNQGFDLKGKRILLLGAGGAARSVLHALLDAGPQLVVIANRTAAKAAELALMFNDLGEVYGGGLDDLQERSFDLILNATAAGLEDKVPPLPDGVLARGGWCYDMVYSDQPTAFVRWGRDHGAARALDGLGMLVEQAAESFKIWRGIRPDTAPVLEALRPGR